MKKFFAVFRQQDDESFVLYQKQTRFLNNILNHFVVSFHQILREESFVNDWLRFFSNYFPVTKWPQSEQFKGIIKDVFTGLRKTDSRNHHRWISREFISSQLIDWYDSLPKIYQKFYMECVYLYLIRTLLTTEELEWKLFRSELESIQIHTAHGSQSIENTSVYSQDEILKFNQYWQATSRNGKQIRPKETLFSCITGAFQKIPYENLREYTQRRIDTPNNTSVQILLPSAPEFLAGDTYSPPPVAIPIARTGGEHGMPRGNNKNKP